MTAAIAQITTMVAAQALALLEADPNISDCEIDFDRDTGVACAVGGHTKGDENNFNDPLHRLSEATIQGFFKLGLDWNKLFNENDCEGCAGEFSIRLEVEPVEVIDLRYIMQELSQRVHRLVTQEFKERGLAIGRRIEVSIAGWGDAELKTHHENGYERASPVVGELRIEVSQKLKK